MTPEDPFSIRWSIETIAEIVFGSALGINLFERSRALEEDWLWGNENYFMNSRGSAFIKFKTRKKVILWKDNIEFMRSHKYNNNNQEYKRFFALTAVYDFVGMVIESVCGEITRK